MPKKCAQFQQVKLFLTFAYEEFQHLYIQGMNRLEVISKMQIVDSCVASHRKAKYGKRNCLYLLWLNIMVKSELIIISGAQDETRTRTDYSSEGF